MTPTAETLGQVQDKISVLVIRASRQPSAALGAEATTMLDALSAARNAFIAARSVAPADVANHSRCRDMEFALMQCMATLTTIVDRCSVVSATAPAQLRRLLEP